MSDPVDGIHFRVFLTLPMKSASSLNFPENAPLPFSAAGTGPAIPGRCPFFSVITVCLNAEKVIPAALSSLLGQTFTDWEWVVVDGASIDSTTEIIRSLTAGDPRVSLSSGPDGGIYQAMNKGVRRARGEFLYFLNADDALAGPDILEEVAKGLQSSGGCDFLYGDILAVGADGTSGRFQPPPPENLLDIFVAGCLPHQGCFQNRALFGDDRIGLFDESYRISADYLWMMSVAATPGIRIQYLPKVIASYDMSGLSSHLEKCLPESHRALNGHTAFLKAIGAERLREGYQLQLMAVRIELEKMRKAYAGEKNKKEKLKEKLADAVQRREAMKAALQAEKRRRGRRGLWGRLKCWIQPQT